MKKALEGALDASLFLSHEYFPYGTSLSAPLLVGLITFFSRLSLDDIRPLFRKGSFVSPPDRLPPSAGQRGSTSRQPLFFQNQTVPSLLAGVKSIPLGSRRLFPLPSRSSSKDEVTGLPLPILTPCFTLLWSLPPFLFRAQGGHVRSHPLPSPSSP